MIKFLAPPPLRTPLGLHYSPGLECAYLNRMTLSTPVLIRRSERGLLVRDDGRRPPKSLIKSDFWGWQTEVLINRVSKGRLTSISAIWRAVTEVTTKSRRGARSTDCLSLNNGQVSWLFFTDFNFISWSQLWQLTSI